jgi:hypothetical protein
MIHLRWLIVPCFLAACPGSSADDVGDDDIDAPTPGTPIRTPGGGVVTPGIAGALNVFVVDDATDAPIVGATVRVGAADAASLPTARGW